MQFYNSQITLNNLHDFSASMQAMSNLHAFLTETNHWIDNQIFKLVHTYFNVIRLSSALNIFRNSNIITLQELNCNNMLPGFHSLCKFASTLMVPYQRRRMYAFYIPVFVMVNTCRKFPHCNKAINQVA